MHRGGLAYIAVELTELVGEDVEFAFAPHDQRSTEVYWCGAWLCTAHPHDVLSRAEREQLLAERRAYAAELRRAHRQAQARLAPATADQPAPDELQLPSATHGQRGAPREEALRAAGAHRSTAARWRDTARTRGVRRPRMARHFLELADAATLETESYLLAQRAVQDAVDAGAMAVLHGEAGLGKTFAVEDALAAPQLPLLWVSFPSRPTPRLIAATLLEAITQRPTRLDRFAIIARLVEHLAQTPTIVVVVDESHC